MTDKTSIIQSKDTTPCPASIVGDTATGMAPNEPPMARPDITAVTAAADEALLTTENPLHRHILENYRRHAILEVTGNWEQIFTPEMTVEHPIYYLNTGGQSRTLDGYEQVAGFYASLADSGTSVIMLEDEQIAVADWGFASESAWSNYARGSAVPDGDPEKFYIVRKRLSMHWPYDQRGRMIGEHVYEHGALADIVEIPGSEFITLDEARQKLLPLLRPLSVFDTA